MDTPLPPDFDPYSGSQPAPKRLRTFHDGERKRQDSRDYDSSDDQQPATQGDLSVKPFWLSVLKVSAGISATIAAALCTTGIVWIASISVSTASKVDVLLARPETVPLRQYDNDMRHLNGEMTETKRRVTALENIGRDED